MTIMVTKEKDHFFNEAQKKVKGDIMRKLIDGFFDTLIENKESFPNDQSIMDLFGSIIIMFNRDLISHMLLGLGLTEHGSKIMRNMFDAVREEVIRKINESKN